ncbi:CHASE domain-containing protein [Thalassotalea piscium]
MAKIFRISKGDTSNILIQLMILFIGISYTTITHFKLQQQIENQVVTALNKSLTVLSHGVSDRLELYHYSLNAMRAAFHGIGTSNISYQSVNNFAKSHYEQLTLPGANGIGFIKKADSEELESFISLARLERPDKKFNIKTLTPHDKSRFIIQYIYPEAKNRQAIGLDIGSETMRRTAALNAALENKIQLSGPITLVQADKKPQQGFLMLLPVYNTIDVPKTATQRINSLLGWTYSPLLIDKVLASLTQFDNNYLTISDTNKDKILTFYHQGNKDNLLPYSDTINTQVMGRYWTIRLQASQAFINDLNLPNKYQAIFNGSILTILVMLVIFSLQLVLHRNAQKSLIERNLAKKHEKELEKTNLRLESEVKSRTKEIAEISMLQTSILNSASYSIIATDVNGIITLFNPAAEKLLGYKASDLIGVKTPSLFHLKEEVTTRAQQLRQEENTIINSDLDTFVHNSSYLKPSVNQWTYVNAKGQHIQVKVSVTSLLNQDDQVVGYLGIGFDLTEQIAHEKALSDAKSAAEKASKAKSEFLANMSHEIRTPMNGLFGTLQLLQERPLDDKARNYLKQAIYSARSLTCIINDILDFSKIEAGKLSIEKRPFTLDELLKSLESDLAAPAKEKGIYLKITSSVEHKFWIGDSVRLRQVFLNLISNAIKFTHSGGVRLEVSLSKTKELFFIVSDTGIGIPEDILPRLFERFEQADSSTTREYGGTGLGLPITRSLIQLMNGRINVESTLNYGSKFYVSLPLEKTNDIPDDMNITSNQHPDLSGKTILLAEDNHINQMVAKAMLDPCKAKVIIAKDGVEAIEYYKQEQPDIIFMDIQMPKMDGIEACKAIKALKKEQIVIALTANVLKEQKDLYRQLFDGYLAKPIDKNELIKLLVSLSKKIT